MGLRGGKPLTLSILRSKVLSAILYIKVRNTLRYRKGVIMAVLKFELHLTDDSCRGFFRYAANAGMAPSELLQSMIADLTGCDSNGSDEEMIMSEWYDRCGYGYASEYSLLAHFMDRDINPVDFLEYRKELAHCEDLEDSDKDYYERMIADMLDGFEGVLDDFQLQQVQKWVDEINVLQS